MLDEARQRVLALVLNGLGLFFKAFQVIELLRIDRVDPGSVDFADPDSYLVESRERRDAVTMTLAGRRSRSNVEWQDNWFRQPENQHALRLYGKENRRRPASGEADVARAIQAELAPLTAIITSVEPAQEGGFSAAQLLKRCRENPQLRRYQPVVFDAYAASVCATVIDAFKLDVTVSSNSPFLSKLNHDAALRRLFPTLRSSGSGPPQRGRLDRNGSIFAADGGVDLSTNYGCHFEVKHATLDAKLANRICRASCARHVIVICRDVHPSHRKLVTGRDSSNPMIRGVITEDDLVRLSNAIVAGEFGANRERQLRERLVAELGHACPLAQPDRLERWMCERGYDVAPKWKATA
ncbi:MAG: HaeII family restriction endonuclease [Planctomycetes bacterium]|nr:HaeII family restriction endonuclease [Planctomycetota bacterium]